MGKALLWAAFGVAMLYVGLGMGMAVEGLQLLEYHNPANIKARAFSMWMGDNFGWVNDITGLSGEGGMLAFLDDELAPYIAELQPIPEESFDLALEEGLSADDFLLGLT